MADLSREQLEKFRPERLLAAASRLITVQNEVLAMPQEQQQWFFSKEGHADAFTLAWFVNIYLSELISMALRCLDMQEDTERLDWITAQSKGYGCGWLCRNSVQGRGMRLHKTSMEGASISPREAIDVARSTK